MPCKSAYIALPSLKTRVAVDDRQEKTIIDAHTDAMPEIAFRRASVNDSSRCMGIGTLHSGDRSIRIANAHIPADTISSKTSTIPARTLFSAPMPAKLRTKETLALFENELM